MLILSRFTGAARELTDALLVNPFAIDEIAEAMRLRPRRCRRRSSSGGCGGCAPPWPRNNVYRWAGKILSALLRIETPEGAADGPSADPSIEMNAAGTLHFTRRRADNARTP